VIVHVPIAAPVRPKLADTSDAWQAAILCWRGAEWLAGCALGGTRVVVGTADRTACTEWPVQAAPSVPAPVRTRTSRTARRLRLVIMASKWLTPGTVELLPTPMPHVKPILTGNRHDRAARNDRFRWLRVSLITVISKRRIISKTAPCQRRETAPRRRPGYVAVIGEDAARVRDDAATKAYDENVASPRGKKAVRDFDADSLIGMTVSRAREVVEGIGGKFGVYPKDHPVVAPFRGGWILVATDDSGKTVVRAERG
jgi:hypothetical protein